MVPGNAVRCRRTMEAVANLPMSRVHHEAIDDYSDTCIKWGGWHVCLKLGLADFLLLTGEVFLRAAVH